MPLALALVLDSLEIVKPVPIVASKFFFVDSHGH